MSGQTAALDVWGITNMFEHLLIFTNIEIFKIIILITILDRSAVQGGCFFLVEHLLLIPFDLSPDISHSITQLSKKQEVESY